MLLLFYSDSKDGHGSKQPSLNFLIFQPYIVLRINQISQMLKSLNFDTNDGHAMTAFKEFFKQHLQSCMPLETQNSLSPSI